MKILLKTLILLIACSSVHAKSPPPGLGSDLPASILLMLDVSSSMNGGASASPLSTPLDVAVDSKGNVFVSQIGHHLIKKFDSDGNFIKSWGGWGTSNGKFRYALRIATDADDNVYVTDYMNHRIQKFDNDGNFMRSFNASGRLRYPDSLEIDKSTGNIYSSKRNQYVVMQNQNGDLLKEMNNYNVSGYQHYPFGLSIHEGYLYIANAYRWSWTKMSKSIDGNSPGYANVKSATSGWAWDIKVSDSGVYVANYNTNQIQKFSHDGNLIKAWGSTGLCAGNSCLLHPAGLSIGPDGNVFVNDRYNHAIKKFDTDGNFLSFIGGKTKLDVAKESIKWIVSNTELNKGANFGLMIWDTSARILVDVKASGAQEIYNMVDGITANCPFASCTDIGKAMLLAQRTVAKYKNWYPEAAKCQNTTLVVLTDGAFRDNHAYYGNLRAKELFTKQDIKTFVVAMRSGANLASHKNLAEAGGTYSNDGDDSNDYSPVAAIHKQKIIDALLEFIRLAVDSNTSTFTKPVLKHESSQEDYVYQSTFEYTKSHQWKGDLKKYQLLNGVPKDSPEWDAAKKLNVKSAASRQIWTIASDFNVSTTINNFVTGNADKLKYLLWENAPTEPTDSQASDLIDFIRGVDSYNEVNATEESKYKLLSGERWKLGDIYHSELKVIGPPSAKSSNANVNSEAYYRYNNAYQGRFRNGNSCGGYCAQRKNIVYVGANDGLLHAFDAKNGEELWAFLPPMLLSKMRTAISSKSGQSVSIYGVDGSPIVKDIYYNYKWRTVLMSGLGMGGRGYFALDVTNPNNPSFLFAFSNDLINKIVSHWDSSGHKTDLGYAGNADSEFAYSKIGDATSTPQIILMPYEGKQKWVAVFGAGFNGGVNDTYGASIYIVDLENQGKVLKRIDIADIAGNSIANSVPAPVVAITPDSTSLANYKGAMVYFADLEGSLWKLNLTNQGTLFDYTQIFKADSTFDNDRMESFQVTPSIDSDKNLWLYYGTGNQQKIQRISDNIQNRVYGIKDSNFPQFVTIKAAPVSSQLKDTTDKGAMCPAESDTGWYFNLDKNERITGQIAVHNESIIASRYIPNTVDLCKSGNATLSEHGYTCGDKERETELGGGIATGAVVFKDKIYIGITGDADKDEVMKDGDKEIGERKGNLIVITPVEKEDKKTIQGKFSTESWRELF